MYAILAATYIEHVIIQLPNRFLARSLFQCVPLGPHAVKPISRGAACPRHGRSA